ncbi:hypothetical protein N0V83_005733 [Neocucurbitaria cava]|uniref:AB hydrolase-1 domain-containing protein n=1 Tax=Neocucurbitaria cava TaxID=798079 RepID=A0A9W9CLJ6_9PLEO|nr:hypothetical protein N0V83_005733 [Neocucurbitaria cava]
MATLTAKLRDAGYTVHSRQLPAVGNPNPPSDLSADIAAVRALVEEAIGDEGNDVVVVPHSWAGILAGSALTGLGKKEREAAAGGGRKDPYVHAKDANIFYNDLPESEKQHWFSQLQSHSLATFYTPATAASWKEIPTSYLLCEDDQAIPAAGQEAMIAGVKDLGGVIEVTRLKASHSPFLSRPEETVEWIRRAAGEEGI